MKRFSELLHKLSQNEFVILFLILTFFLTLYFWQLFSPDPGMRRTLDYDFYHVHVPYNWLISYFLYHNWLPLWDPLSENGYPILGDALFQLFYIPNILRILLFRPQDIFHVIYSLEIMHLLHLYILGIGTFIFLRFRNKYTFFASLFGSIAIVFSGFIINRTGHGHITFVETLTWFPWVLFSFSNLIEKQSIRYFLLSAILVYLTLTAGYVPIAFFSLLILGFYLFYSYSIQNRFVLKNYLLSVITFILGIGISGVMLIPQSEYALYTSRINSTSRLEDVQIYSNTPTDIVRNLIYPFNYENGFFSYFGILVITLVGIYFYIKKYGNSEKYFIFLGIGILISSLGESLGPLIGPFYVLPTLGLLRVPSRLMFFSTFSFIVLATSALHECLVNIAVRKRTVNIIKKTSISLLPFFLLLVLLFLGFQTVTLNWNGTSEKNVSATGNNIVLIVLLIVISWFILVQLLRSQSKSAMFFFLVILFMDLSIINAKILPFAKFSDLLEANVPNVPFSAYTNNGFKNITRSSAYFKNWFYVDVIYDLNPSTRGFAPLHFATIEDLEKYRNKTIDIVRGTQEFSYHGATYGRWWIMGNCVFVNTQKEILDLLISKKVNVENTVLLLTKDKKYFVNYCNNKDVNYTLSLENYENNSLQLQYTADNNGVLYLSETYYPDWHAYIDGREVPIVQADYAFRAIPIIKGKHTVRFIFKPQSLVYGSILSLGSLLALGVICGFLILRRKIRPYT